jgi:two-component system alkaline phosphatase synthesis response regulator PhoP
MQVKTLFKMPNFAGCTATSLSIKFAIVTRFYLPMPKRILIADDDSSVRHAIRMFIEHRSQFEVCEAANGNEALQQAAAFNPDLIVLDLSMPTANGVEVAALLHVRMPRTPVVIYTMYGDLVRGSLAKILGIAALVPKSDGVAELLHRIKALLEAEDALASQGD